MDKETLYRFFAGEASSEEKNKIKEWLEASPDHDEELLRERELFDAVMLAEPANVASLYAEEPRVAKRNGLLRRVTIEVMKVAAVVVLIAGCMLLWHRSEMKTLASASNSIDVPSGQRASVTLADGTKVWLNSRSELTYPAAFAEGQRRVRLDGEAYFEVAHDASRPFTVETTKGEVRVLGTKFNVEAYSDMTGFRTSLVEGSVKVTGLGGKAESVVLSPGQEAQLVGGRLRVSSMDGDDNLRWREGLMCFKNATFTGLMKRMEKCYGVRIVVENRRMDSYVCSGKFRIADGIDRVLHVLQRDAGYTFARSQDGDTIYIR